MHRKEEVHGRSWTQETATSKGEIVYDRARQVAAPPRPISDISSRRGLDHVLGYAYHGTTGRCSWGSMGMLDRRMNQNVRTCTSCQISRGHTPQVARDGLGWVWRRPRQLSEADGLLRMELSQMMAPTFPGSPGTLRLAALEAQPRDYQQEY